MTISPLTAKVALIGHLPQGEIFNTGFWISVNATLSDAAAANALAAGIANAIASDATKVFQQLLPPTAGYDEVRVYCYPNGGPKSAFIGTAPITGGVGTATGATLPLQTTLVATLRTGFAGRSYRGRMYFPCVAADLANHQMTPGFPTGLANRVAALFTTVNGLANVGVVVVLSQHLQGFTSPVTTVTVDSKLDIQRRHAGHQVALSKATAVVTP